VSLNVEDDDRGDVIPLMEVGIRMGTRAGFLLLLTVIITNYLQRLTTFPEKSTHQSLSPHGWNQATEKRNETSGVTL
jgi:hypothetical protein